MDQSQAHAVQAMLIFMPFIMLVVVVLVIIPWWFIWKKAGFSPWFSLLTLVPIVNIVMMYVLAFSEWKVVPVAQPQPGLGYSYPPSPLPPSSPQA